MCLLVYSNFLFCVLARSPKQWRDSLANYYKNFYSKELENEGGGGGGGGGNGGGGAGPA